jgi:uncharacterized membrane protein YphA (DoxX/SURF4 family)
MPRTLPNLRPLAWPFRSRRSAPLWLAVRLYLAWVWLGFGTGKVRSGWLTRNPMESILEAVAAGHTPAPFGVFRPVARLLLDTGADAVLSVAIPVAELALGLAFAAGAFVAAAAVVGTLLNLSLVLAGIASLAFDGRIILLQLLLLAAAPVAAHPGVLTAAAALRRALRGRRGRAQRSAPPISSRHPRAT